MPKTNKIYILFIFTHLKRAHKEPPYGFLCYSKSDAKDILDEYKSVFGNDYQGYKFLSLDVNDEGILR